MEVKECDRGLFLVIFCIRHATIGGIRTERQPVFPFVLLWWGWGWGCGITQMDESTSSNDEQRGKIDHLLAVGYSKSSRNDCTAVSI